MTKNIQIHEIKIKLSDNNYKLLLEVKGGMEGKPTKPRASGIFLGL